MQERKDAKPLQDTGKSSAMDPCSDPPNPKRHYGRKVPKSQETLSKSQEQLSNFRKTAAGRGAVGPGKAD
jgi:hypothetical protein